MSEERKDGGPAFPRPCGEYDTASLTGGAYNASQPGMSLRDWFAGQALAGLLAQEDKRTWTGISTDEDGIRKWRRELLAKDGEICYLAADAMIAAREKQP